MRQKSDHPGAEIESSQNSRNLVLFGPPGVGKGAQAELLSRRYGLFHLSTGEVIRDEIASGTALGLQVKEAVSQGQFADDEIVLGIVLSRIDKPEYKQGFVLDGFPRNVHQAERFEQLLGERGRKVSRALLINAPEDTILARLTGRMICSQCGKTYHQLFQRPSIRGICDACKGKVSQRHDDDPATHKERLRVYHEKTAPLAEYYEKASLLARINGDQTLEAVAADISKAINGTK
jgi:adenylate kinase